MSLTIWHVATVFVTSALFLIAVAQAAAQGFFKGKTVVVLVGTAAGGGFDTYSRMMARHIGKHLPGNPTIVVQNMPGAGQLIAANHLYNRSSRDGLTIGHFSGSMIFRHVMGDKSVLFDGKKFGWLGTPAPERHTCVVTEKSGVKTLADWSASKRTLRFGSLGPGNSTSAWPHLLKATLGLSLTVIEGFKGTADIRLAAEAGEVDAACWGWDSIKVTWAKGIESGFVRPLIQTMIEPHPDLPNVALAIQQAKSKEDQALLRLAAQAYGPASIAYSLPPGLPKDRLQTLQAAFMATMKDADFLAEAKKANLVISPIDGATIEQTVANLYRAEPKLLERFREVIEASQPQR